ncbi:sensor histidine kinase [Planctobacterium marinum]|uniref:histidine kinase n=1 Tax=Planctobacterium marinum TaxID=1631968 RepID=A0AA48KSE8_9ALTE|nr:hypothetical protein MACH26_25880 [Planctobacterium marinum]
MMRISAIPKFRSAAFVVLLIILSGSVIFAVQQQGVAALILTFLAGSGVLLLTWLCFDEYRHAQYQAQLHEIQAQLKQINQGKQDALSIDVTAGPYRELVAEINEHLAMETERLLQEQNFSADASHELRTPLAGLRLQAQVAQRTDKSELKARALENIISAVDRSTRLVEQLLVYSRLSRRRNHAENTRIDITELLQAQLLKTASLISNKQLEISTNFAEIQVPKIFLHRDQMMAAIENLLYNAIEHSPEKGKIAITLSAASDTLQLVFEDNGPGLSDKDKHHVIVPFQKSSSNKQKGTGLGLAIVNKVVQLHGGDLQLLDAKSGGLKVQISLPL